MESEMIHQSIVLCIAKQTFRKLTFLFISICLVASLLSTLRSALQLVFVLERNLNLKLKIDVDVFVFGFVYGSEG
jgi:hypothetical protein